MGPLHGGAESVELGGVAQVDADGHSHCPAPCDGHLVGAPLQALGPRDLDHGGTDTGLVQHFVDGRYRIDGATPFVEFIKFGSHKEFGVLYHDEHQRHVHGL